MTTPSNGSSQPSTALIRRTDDNQLAMSQPLQPQDLDQAMRLSEMLAKSDLIPSAYRGKPQNVLLAIIRGRELGLQTLQALSLMHIIEGKPTLSADAMVGLVKRSGVCSFFRLVESTAERATYETLRVGEDTPQRMAFTMDEAKQARLTGKDNWQKFPAAMLRARCQAALARAVYQDVLAGVYDPDEIEAERASRAQSYRAAPPAPVASSESTVIYDEPAHDPQTGEVLDEQPAPVAAAQPTGGIGADLARLDACASMPDVLAVGKELVMRYKGTPAFTSINRAISAKQAQVRGGGAK